MRTNTLILSICMALLTPLTATAKKPAPDACSIFAESPVSTDNSFDVVVRPEGPGQWFKPTVSVEIVVPVISTSTSPNAYSQTVTQTFGGLGKPNIARATFIIPDRLSIDTSRSVGVFATVSEPVNRGKSIESQCETTTNF
jgi:hypothetical protein